MSTEEEDKAPPAQEEEKDDETTSTTPAMTEEEARAIAEATASADASYVPTPSLLNAATPEPLLLQVDGPSLLEYSAAESVYVARNVPVPLRGKFDVPIHVSAGGSVVEYAIETLNYDICFGITAEREEGLTVVKENDRVDSQIQPVTGKFLVGSVPCALVFTFDNEYSWFREKTVSYRVTITPPSVDNIVAGRRRRANAALKAVVDDKHSATKRLDRATKQSTALTADIVRMEKELAEKKKSLDVAKKEENWLTKRVDLRTTQETMLTERIEHGWEDENEAKKNEEANKRAKKKSMFW